MKKGYLLHSFGCLSLAVRVWPIIGACAGVKKETNKSTKPNFKVWLIPREKDNFLAESKSPSCHFR